MRKEYSTYVEAEETVSVNSTPETPVIDKLHTANAQELLVKVRDEGASNSTLRMYGSLDGTDWSQLYFYRLDENIYDPSVAGNTKLSSTGVTKVVHIWTDKCFPFMRITAQRTAAGAADVTMTTKIAR